MNGPQYAGPSLYRKISANDENEVNIKSTSGKLVGIHATNVNAAVRYLKIFDKASTPVNGTDTPLMTFPIPAAGAPLNLDFSKSPIIFKNGLGMSLVTGAADSDTTAPAAAEQIVHLLYK